MSDAKKQHYVPRFYLSSFTDGGKLYAVRRNENGAGPIFGSGPMGVCAEGYLYEVELRAPEHEGGHLEKGAVEKRLSDVEDVFAKAHRKLLACLDDRVLPDGDERGELIDQLARFIAFAVARHPKWLREVRDKAGERADKLMLKGFLTDDDVSEMDSLGLNGEFESIVELAYLDAALFGTCEGAPVRSLVDLMMKMDCRFLVAADGAEFVTSSFPVHAEWLNESEENPCGFYFPLSPRYAAVFHRNEGHERTVGIYDADKAMNDSFNRCLMNGNGIWEFLIARDRTVLEELLKSYREPDGTTG